MSHAVVIGSGIAGLLAARVLSRHHEQVTVVDRDAFPDAPDHRSGVPQSHHLHGLQPRGAEIIYRLFPEAREALARDGAAVADDMHRVKLVTREGLLPLAGGRGEPALLFSRFLLEWRLRETLRADDGVRFRPGAEVVGLVPRHDGGVAGARLRTRGSGDGPETVEADLVVDASGRSSRVTDWLADLAHGDVEEETLNSDLWYASRFYERPEGFPDEFSLIIVAARAPHRPHVGVVQEIENGRWHVSLGGVDGHRVPTDDDGFARWAEALPDPTVREVIRTARPVSPIRGWRTPTSRWRHFERMRDWPAGLIVLGDAVCALNPTYGQGMTVAAMEAAVLEDCLREDLDERRFQRRIARTAAGPWLVASTEDLGWPGVRLDGARPPRRLALMRRYVAWVLRAAVADRALADRYFAVVGMTATPASLLAPTVLARAARHALVRRFRPVPAERHALSPEGLAAAQAMPDAPVHRGLLWLAARP